MGNKIVSYSSFHLGVGMRVGCQFVPVTVLSTSDVQWEN